MVDGALIVVYHALYIAYLGQWLLMLWYTECIQKLQ